MVESYALEFGCRVYVGEHGSTHIIKETRLLKDGPSVIVTLLHPRSLHHERRTVKEVGLRQ
jgi:hypothetical protein